MAYNDNNHIAFSIDKLPQMQNCGISDFELALLKRMCMNIEHLKV